MKPSRRRTKNGYGSQTNASDAIDDIKLGPHPSADELLDAGVQETYWRSAK